MSVTREKESDIRSERQIVIRPPQAPAKLKSASAPSRGSILLPQAPAEWNPLPLLPAVQLSFCSAGAEQKNSFPQNPACPLSSERAGGGDVQVVQVYSIYSLYTIISILL